MLRHVLRNFVMFGLLTAAPAALGDSVLTADTSAKALLNDHEVGSRDRLLYSANFYIGAPHVVYSLGWQSLGAVPQRYNVIKIIQTGDPRFCRLGLVGDVAYTASRRGPVHMTRMNPYDGTFQVRTGLISEINFNFTQSGWGNVNCGLAIYGQDDWTAPDTSDTYEIVSSRSSLGRSQALVVLNLVLTRSGYEHARGLLTQLGDALRLLQNDADDRVTMGRLRRSFEYVESAFIDLDRQLIINPDDRELVREWYKLNEIYQDIREQF